MTNDLNGQQPLPVVAGELGQLFQPKLLPRLRETRRLRRYKLKTAKAYVQRVHHYINFHGKQHPQQTGRLLASVRYGEQTRMAGMQVEADAEWRRIVGPRMALAGRVRPAA